MNVTSDPTLDFFRYGQVVYSSLEPLVHTYVKDLRPANGYTGELQRLQDVLVFLRVLTKEHAEVSRQIRSPIDDFS